MGSFDPHSYDDLAKTYQSFRETIDTSGLLEEFLQEIGPLPGPGTGDFRSILDAGCGTGSPTLREICRRGYRGYGVDLSLVMLNACRENTPTISLSLQDLESLAFRDHCFDGVVCMHAIIHVPKKHHPVVIEEFRRVLKPDGLLLLCTGSEQFESTMDFLGKRMFFSYPSPPESLSLLSKSGFTRMWDRILNIKGEEFYWILARSSC